MTDLLQQKLPPPIDSQNDQSDAILARFLALSEGVRLASASLRPGAEVGITFTDLSGDWRIVVTDAGEFVFEPYKAVDPDFDLHISRQAVESICSKRDTDIGDLGVSFFELIKSKDQTLKITVAVHSGLVKLTRRGWLGVVAKGGPKVVGWMAQKGFRGPGAIATAIGKLK